MIVATELLAEPNLFTSDAFGGTTLCRKVNPAAVSATVQPVTAKRTEPGPLVAGFLAECELAVAAIG